VWGRHDAHDALRGRASAPHTHPEMVLAQGLGHVRGAPSRRQESDRRSGSAPPYHPAPDVGSQFRWRKEVNAAA
jgi:hypothetical protein